MSELWLTVVGGLYRHLRIPFGWFHDANNYGTSDSEGQLAGLSALETPPNSRLWSMDRRKVCAQGCTSGSSVEIWIEGGTSGLGGGDGDGR
jgi:hypothetical protein